MFKAEPDAGIPEGKRFVTRAVVSHHAGNNDTQFVVIIDGCLKEGDSTFFLLIWKYIGEGNA